MTNFYLSLPFPKSQVYTISYVQSLACSNINSYIPLSNWVVHLLFIFCRFRWLCVHNHRCMCRVWFGFVTSSFISSIPSEAVMSILYLWSPFPLAAPCHFLAGFVCVCEGTAGEGWCLSFFFPTAALSVCWSCQGGFLVTMRSSRGLWPWNLLRTKISSLVLIWYFLGLSMYNCFHFLLLGK